MPSSAEAPPVVATLTLTAVEGDALACLDALLDSSRATSIPRAAVVHLEALRPEFIAVGARRVAIASVRMLTESGGWRERTVLRDGRRTHGRLWDAHLNTDFGLTFTEATRTFWLAAARTLSSIGGRGKWRTGDASGEGARQRRRVLRDMVPVRNTGTGDWVFFALACENLAAFDLSPEDHEALSRKLRLGSPLAALAGLDGNMDTAQLRAHSAALTTPGAVRVLECAEDFLVDAWRERVTAAYASREDSAVYAARWAQMAAVLEGHLAAIELARRSDLARSVMRLVRALATEIMVEPADQVRAVVGARPRVANVKERDEAVAAVARVVNLGASLARLRERLGAERYGDERYEEAQVYLRHFDAVLGPCRARVDDLVRVMSGTIG